MNDKAGLGGSSAWCIKSLWTTLAARALSHAHTVPMLPLSACVKVLNAIPRSFPDSQENAEQAVREMLQQFSRDRGLPEVHTHRFCICRRLWPHLA